MAFESICELLDRVGLDEHPSIAEHYQVQTVDLDHTWYEAVEVIHLMRYLSCKHQCRCTFERLYRRTLRYMAELDVYEGERYRERMRQEYEQQPDEGYSTDTDV